MKNEIADRYGLALFEIAKENNTLIEKKEVSEILLDTINKTDDFFLFLKAVKISNEQKKKTIKEIFNDFLDRDMINLISLLIDKNRTFYLNDILENFVERVNKDQGIEVGIIHSARPLSQENILRIQKALETKTKKKIILKNKINPSLIAGIKVTINNKVIDVTIKKQIEEMKQNILKGGLS